MSALSLTRSVREHRFQMHHYRGCAGDPLMSWRCKAAFFCLLFFAAGVWTGDMGNRCAETWVTLWASESPGAGYALEPERHHESASGVR
jgi:hypothetical protein